jgi:LacI family transcriptional regulator
MGQKRRITIKDVAEAAGVSTQTVSRVMNNRPDVAPETLYRVQQVIKQTGYAPNILARSLIRGRTHTLGVVAYGLDYFGPSRVLTGIEQEAARLGYSIFLNLIHAPETADVDALLGSLFARQVDGIIWAVPQIGDNRSWVREKSPDFSVPVVFVGGMTEPATLPVVGVDNLAIGSLATEHLLSGGQRCIGIITGPLDWWEAQQRQLGWREALERKGLGAGVDLVAVGDWSTKSGEHGLYQLLAQAPDIDAIFASNDQMALGVLYGAHHLGRRVPQDLALAGVDSIPESAHFWPPLTTVRQRLREAGSLVVREIDQLIRSANLPHEEPGLGLPEMTLLQPELIVRESSRTQLPV